MSGPKKSASSNYGVEQDGTGGDEFDSRAIAGLAAQLMSGGTTASQDVRDIQQAVRMASRILQEASKPIKRHAYEIFPVDCVMSMEDIADRFAEEKWPKLMNKGTVTKRIRKLLDSIHVEIQKSRSLTTTSFRQRSVRGTDVERVTSTAIVAIKNLFRDLGMSHSFGQSLDEVAKSVWYQIVDVWLQTDEHLKEVLQRSSSFNREFFSKICVDVSYEQYTASFAPPSSLTPDGLLSLTLWLKNEFRNKLVEKPVDDVVHTTLARLDHWPEWLCPGYRRYFNPFAECIAELGGNDVSNDELGKKFDQGVQRFSEMGARFSLMHFSRELATTEALEEINLIEREWNLEDTEETRKFAETFPADPLKTIETARNFLRGEPIFFPTVLPFHGAGICSEVLHPYARDLDTLAYELRELRRISRYLNRTAVFVDTALEKVEAEKVRIVTLDQELTSSVDSVMARHAAEMELLKNGLYMEVAPGRIKPHLLFRYAAERGIRDDLLIKK